MKTSDKPTKEKYGFHTQNGFDDEPSGWVIEGGEEAYDKALKEYMIEDEWNKPVDDVVHVPDVFDGILNKVGMQFNFVKLSGKNERQAVCDIVRGCQKFFKEYYSTDKEG